MFEKYYYGVSYTIYVQNIHNIHHTLSYLKDKKIKVYTEKKIDTHTDY